MAEGLIAGKPAPTGIQQLSKSARYRWEPRLPAMGREAAPTSKCLPWVSSGHSRLTAFDPKQPVVKGTGCNLFWDFGIFWRTKKNPADVNLRGFRIVEAEVGIEPA